MARSAKSAVAQECESSQLVAAVLCTFAADTLGSQFVALRCAFEGTASAVAGRFGFSRQEALRKCTEAGAAACSIVAAAELG